MALTPHSPDDARVPCTHSPIDVLLSADCAPLIEGKLIKIGAKVIAHVRYIAFQMAEVAVSRSLFADILQMIGELRPPPVASTT